MKQLVLALLLLSSTITLFAQEKTEPSGAKVTLGLEEYEALKEGSKAGDVTVIDTIRLGGSFRDRSLTLNIVGRSIGKRNTLTMLSSADELTIWSCSGEGIVNRLAEGGFGFTPTASTFDVQCRVVGTGGDRIELHTSSDVLAVTSLVSDGELVAGENEGDGGRGYSLVRQSIGGQDLPPTAQGRYRITLLPDETRFLYQLSVHNPNRARREFDVTLRSGEHLQQVDSDATFEANGNNIHFELPPGDTDITMTGQLPGGTFTAPLDASVQYVMLDTHPLLRPQLTGQHKRVAAAETGLQAEYRGPLALQIGKGEQLTWTISRLEALHTTSYAIHAARHVFFIPAEGDVLGESSMDLDNQGASDVTLPLEPTPTFAALQSEPLLMTKGKDGRVTIPLSSGAQTLLVQHKQKTSRFMGFGSTRIIVPQLDVPSSSTSITVSYPHQWYPLVQSFSTRTKVWVPTGGEFLMIVLLAVWSERLLTWLGIEKRKRIAMAVLLAISAAMLDSMSYLLIIANIVLTMFWLVQKLRAMRWTLPRVAAVGVGVVAIGVLGLAFVTQNRIMSRSELDSASGVSSYNVNAPPPPPATVPEPQREMQANLKTAAVDQTAQNYETRAAGKGDYQGLPAKFEIPSGERSTYFSQELVDVKHEQAVRVWMISSTLVWWISVLITIAGLFLLWRARRELMEGWRARFPQASQGEATATA